MVDDSPETLCAMAALLQVARGYSHGAVDYLFKPFAPEILQSKVNVFVELAKKTMALSRQNRELESAKRELGERARELAR